MNIFTSIATVTICLHAVSCQVPNLLGSMGSMGMGMAMGAEMTAADYMILDNLVKHVVGSTATPSPSMILLAQQQGGPPTSFTRMMPHITLMQDIARRAGVKPPGTSGPVTEDQISNHVMQRAMNWINQRTTFEAMADSPALTATMMRGNGAGLLVPVVPPTLVKSPAATTSVSDTPIVQKPAQQPADLFNMMVMGQAMGMF